MMGKFYMQSNLFRYKAFISYSHADGHCARRLHRSLESYRIPKHIKLGKNIATSHLGAIFRDRDELSTSHDLSADIQQALAESENLIVICSPNSASSRWVNEEVKKFKQLGRSDNIYCYLIGDPAHSFPPATLLGSAEGDSGQTNIEPLAADARQTGDGLTGAKLKLISGLLNVRFDELVRRESARRQKRLSIIASFALIGMGFTTALSFYALDQRNVARIARDQAVQQRNRAEQARTEGEEVVSFLVDLFEIADPDESLGNSITARQILDRGSRRLDKELASQPLNQARMLTTLGTVYQSLGVFNISEQHHQRAYDIRHENLGAEHEDTLHALQNLAAIAFLKADYSKMEALARQSLALNTKLYGASAPSSLAALSDIGTAQSGLGDIRSAEYHSRQVLALARKSNGLDKKVLETYVRRQAINLHDLGQVEPVEELYLESLQICREVYAKRHPCIAFALDNLAIYYDMRGDVVLAEPLYREALAMLVDIYGAQHPEVAQTQGNLAGFLFDLSQDEDTDGPAMLAEARSLLKLALASNQKLRPEHPNTADNLVAIAAIEKELGNIAAAEEMLNEALQIFAIKLPQDSYDIIRARLDLAKVLLAGGNLRGAESNLRQTEAAIGSAETESEEDLIQEIREQLLALQNIGDSSAKN